MHNMPPSSIPIRVGDGRSSRMVTLPIAPGIRQTRRFDAKEETPTSLRGPRDGGLDRSQTIVLGRITLWNQYELLQDV